MQSRLLFDPPLSLQPSARRTLPYLSVGAALRSKDLLGKVGGTVCLSSLGEEVPLEVTRTARINEAYRKLRPRA